MSFVKYEPKGNIAYLIIDREKALNALNSQVLADLDAALNAVDLSEIRCLIVRGAGEKSFVAGADIAQMKELSKEEAEAFGKQGNDVMRKLEAFPIPTIAAVGGYAGADADNVVIVPGAKPEIVDFTRPNHPTVDGRPVVVPPAVPLAPAPAVPGTL